MSWVWQRNALNLVYVDSNAQQAPGFESTNGQRAPGFEPSNVGVIPTFPPMALHQPMTHPGQHWPSPHHPPSTLMAAPPSSPLSFSTPTTSACPPFARMAWPDGRLPLRRPCIHPPILAVCHHAGAVADALVVFSFVGRGRALFFHHLSKCRPPKDKMGAVGKCKCGCCHKEGESLDRILLSHLTILAIILLTAAFALRKWT